MDEIINHINSIIFLILVQSNKAINIQEKCNRLYLAFYLIPSLSKGLKRLEAVIISIGKRSFTAFIPEICLEIKCKVMKNFYPLPDSIVEDDNKITLMWNNENSSRIIELFTLKKILLDIDIDYESIPFEIFAFNVWELYQTIQKPYKKLFK
jgi:hypothetical protein